ncbi:MAG: hypothetical protein EOP38_00275 [Rubrivivax sp.]|nr:MAG: hypothetical protein EOP38_00275 [Rubrivivax sp.]
MLSPLHSATLALGLMAFATASATAAPCTNSIDTSSPVVASGFGYNLSNTRNNASLINSTNVASLQVGYVNVAPDTDERRGAPVVTKQTLYTTNGFKVVATDRVKGCQFWSYELASSDNLGGGDEVRSIAYVPSAFMKPALIIAGDNTRNLYAINAKTGALAWKATVGTDDKNHKVTGVPQFYNGKLIVPISSKEVIKAVLDLGTVCCRSHGMVQSLDAYTGKILWSYHTTPDAKMQWSGHQGPNGAPVWATPTIDTRRNLVYIGTGQNYTYPTTTTSDAIIALNFNTGAVKWVFQAEKNDAWNSGCGVPFPLNGTCDQPQGDDHDFGAAPVLATLKNGRNLVVAGSKGGTLFGIDPDTGAKVWSNKLGVGSNLGGIHWGIAVDDSRAYVGVSDVYVNKASAITTTDFGAITAANMKLIDKGRPGVYAVDLMTGAIVWEDHPTHVFTETGETVKSIFSAATSVTNDVAIFSSLDGVVHAYRSTDGKLLWKYDTAKPVTGVDGIAGNGGTIDQVGAYVGGNNMFVNSGYHHFGGRNAFQAGPGNALYVFKLPNTN